MAERFSRPKLMVVGQLIATPHLTRPKILIGNNWYTWSGLTQDLDTLMVTVHFFLSGYDEVKIGKLEVPEDFEIWLKTRE